MEALAMYLGDLIIMVLVIFAFALVIMIAPGKGD